MKRSAVRGGELARSLRLPRPAPWRNAPFALFVVGILAYGAALAWYTLDRFDLVNLIREGYWDDAFYYFQIAYHMAEGRFSTFDGGLTRTNGYHPLWLFLLTPFYWLFDKTEALFAVKAFEIMLVAGGVALVAAAARVARLPWILLFAALPTLCAQGGMLWGMEAALVLFMLGLLLLAMCLFAHHPARWKWPLAALAFALPWARLELAAVAAAATVALGFLEWSGRLSCARDAPPSGPCGFASRGALFWLLRLRAAVPLAGAFAGVLVYFAYNGVVFGGVVPVSGAVKADVWTPRTWEEEGGYGLAKSFEAFVRSDAFDNELLIALEVCVYALLAWWLSGRARNREDTLLLVFVAGVFGLAAGHLAMFAQCVLFLHPWKVMSLLWEWYFVPAHLMEAFVVPLRCCMGIYLIRRLVAPRLPRTSDVLRWAAIVAATVVLAAKVDFAKPFRFVDMAQGDLIGFDVRSYMGTVVLNRLLPEDTLVGSWDSGVVGYFSRSPVMNLDGLVNSYDYKRALESEAHAFGDFDEPPQGGSVQALWRRHGVFHFGNVFGEGGPGEWAEKGMLFRGAQSPRRQRWQFKIFRSDSERPEWAASPTDLAAWFRERMAPHLEFQADGIGLLVEGRTVQAFAWNCTANEHDLAEWTFGGAVGAVSRWTQLADGLCGSEVLLPHGHLPTVRVRRTASVASYSSGRRPPGDQRDAAGRASWGEGGSACRAEGSLPEYGIATVSTGQFTAKGRVWGGERQSMYALRTACAGHAKSSLGARRGGA